MVNGYAVAHGGLVAALADSAFALACNSRGRGVRSRPASTSASSRPRTRVTSSWRGAEERALRGRSGIYDVTVRRDATVVAEFRGRSRALPT